MNYVKYKRKRNWYDSANTLNEDLKDKESEIIDAENDFANKKASKKIRTNSQKIKEKDSADMKEIGSRLSQLSLNKNQNQQSDNLKLENAGIKISKKEEKFLEETENIIDNSTKVYRGKTVACKRENKKKGKGNKEHIEKANMTELENMTQFMFTQLKDPLMKTEGGQDDNFVINPDSLLKFMRTENIQLPKKYKNENFELNTDNMKRMMEMFTNNNINDPQQSDINNLEPQVAPNETTTNTENSKIEMNYNQFKNRVIANGFQHLANIMKKRP